MGVDHASRCSNTQFYIHPYVHEKCSITKLLRYAVTFPIYVCCSHVFASLIIIVDCEIFTFIAEVMHI